MKTSPCLRVRVRAFRQRDFYPGFRAVFGVLITSVYGKRKISKILQIRVTTHYGLQFETLHNTAVDMGPGVSRGGWEVITESLFELTEFEDFSISASLASALPQHLPIESRLSSFRASLSILTTERQQLSRHVQVAVGTCTC